MKETFLNAINDPYFWGMIGGYLYSCVVQSLPEPDLNSSKRYVIVYRFIHSLGANWQQVNNAKAIQTFQKDLTK